jgi:hypothetical protein
MLNWEIWRTIFLLGSLYITYDVFNDWKGMFLVKTIPCPECDGAGYVEYERTRPASFTNPYGYLDTLTEICDNCAGFGSIEPLEDAEE